MPNPDYQRIKKTTLDNVHTKLLHKYTGNYSLPGVDRLFVTLSAVVSSSDVNSSGGDVTLSSVVKFGCIGNIVFMSLRSPLDVITSVTPSISLLEVVIPVTLSTSRVDVNSSVTSSISPLPVSMAAVLEMYKSVVNMVNVLSVTSALGSMLVVPVASLLGTKVGSISPLPVSTISVVT